MGLRRVFQALFSKERDIFKELERKGCNIPDSTRRSMHSPGGIDTVFPWLVEIGENCKISTQVFFFTHDASTSIPCRALKVGKITIGDNVFIGHKVTILPGVSIGDNTIVGANSVVLSDCEPNSVYAGNPAKFICSIDEIIKKRSIEMATKPIFEHPDGFKHYNYNKYPEDCNLLKKRLSSTKIGFIRFLRK